jgi:hypothetical protein
MDSEFRQSDFQTQFGAMTTQCDPLILEASLEAILSNMPPEFCDSMSVEDKLLKYTELISHKRKDL